ncbi:Retrovirus-related Pol polyprotein from transposon TNT 1-94 [Papilio machaon]|uniref:Retrovirus-related Pol polyprotein from transposon TNT 1-94 n=1 Tax=Papilio machaon TaxID=76193 RepID=A0A0N1IFR1_PAPMA|nr:Retrovirus-related Pol polyprotein from transposon TNT 1-94 [Papilio machaon]
MSHDGYKNENSSTEIRSAGVNAAYIEKLVGSSNFHTWKFDMELYLTDDDLWKYTQVSPQPEDVADVRRDQKARARIGLMVDQRCRTLIRKTKTAKEAWEALSKAYEDKGINNKCRLLGRLVSMRLEQFQTVEKYVTAILSVSQQLSDIGKDVDDEILATLMLQGLPKKYEPLKMAIENSNITITTDYVKTKLYNLSDESTPSTSFQQDDSALTASKKKWKGKFKANQKTKPIKCFICEGNHKATECPDNPNRRKNCSATANVFATSGQGSLADWVIDSGASSHMTNEKGWLRNYVAYESKREIACADGGKVYGLGVGDVVDVDGSIRVRDAMYAPDLATNLLSVNTLVKRGRVVVFSNRGCEIYKSDDCKVNGSVVAGDCWHLVSSMQKDDQLMLWHRRMGHLGVSNLKLLRDKLADGVSFQNSKNNLECVSCLMGKQTRQPFPKRKVKRAREVLELVHSDICGPMSVNSMSGYRYFMTLIDDKTRKTFVYLLKNKSEAIEKIKEFKVFAERQTEKKLKSIRTDNGKEYVNNDMKSFTKKYGIVHQLTVEYTPEQNGVAERANRTLMEKARCMLHEAGLEKHYWAEALVYAVFLKNRSPTKALKDKTPEEAWTGRKVNLGFVKVFGCKAYMHVPDQKRRKLDPKSKELILLGYCENSKAYRLLDPVSGNLHKARDVVFFESTLASRKQPSSEILTDEQNSASHQRPSPEFTVVPLTSTQSMEEVVCGEETEDGCRNETARHLSGNRGGVIMPESEEIRAEIEQDRTGAVSSVTEETEDRDDTEQWYLSSDAAVSEENNHRDDQTDDQTDARRYPMRNRKSRQFPDHVLYQAVLSEESGFGLEEPINVREALAGTDSLLWHEAIKEELDALHKNQTWQLVKREPDQNVIDSKWVLKVKTEAGNKKRYKARLVARGFKQRGGVDYFETYSPVIRHSSLRLLLAMAAENKLKIDQMDVKTAFLNGYMEETVYMKQPEGFEEKGKEDYVCLLKRSLYGLKQAPRAWNQRLDSALKQLKFTQLDNEPCVYMRRSQHRLIILAVYVDDLLIFWNNKAEMQQVKKELRETFEMRDLGKADLFLGMRLQQTEDDITLDQEGYIEKILARFDMQDCKPVSTPLIAGYRLTKPVETNYEPPNNIPYQELVGSLMYLAVCTRPDVAFAISYLSQFNSCYGEQHWQTLKRVLRYLKGTKSLGLVFKQSGRYLEGFVDADHAGDITDRKSYSGYIFKFGSAPVSWESRKQTVVALSSAEAEYISLSNAAREAVFLKRLFGEITGVNKTIKLSSDSQSAIAMANSEGSCHKRSKHIDVRVHFIREALRNKVISLKYLETESMVADIFTKALPRGKFEFCLRGMGMSLCKC